MIWSAFLACSFPSIAFSLSLYRRNLSARLVRLQEAEAVLKGDEEEFNRQVAAFEEKVQQVTALGEKVKKQSEEVSLIIHDTTKRRYMCFRTAFEYL
jgi:hypothetical protein